MAKDGMGGSDNEDNSVIRADGTLNKELLSIKLKKLYDSYRGDRISAKFNNDEHRAIIADAKQDLISDLMYNVFGLE